jgi:hypothetical protein
MGAELSPEYWRARAEETRTLAETMRYTDTRTVLSTIADDYERIAKAAEEMRKRARIPSV